MQEVDRRAYRTVMHEGCRYRQLRSMQVCRSENTRGWDVRETSCAEEDFWERREGYERVSADGWMSEIRQTRAKVRGGKAERRRDD